MSLAVAKALNREQNMCFDFKGSQFFALFIAYFKSEQPSRLEITPEKLVRHGTNNRPQVNHALLELHKSLQHVITDTFLEIEDL